MIVNMLVGMKRQTDPDVLLLQAVADPARLAILRQLSDVPEVCACDFTETCDVSQPTVSHHLKVLRDAGWIDGERRGTWIWYSLRPEAAARFRALAGALGHMGVSETPSRRLAVVQPQPVDQA
jgi:DNA-binding transcriptional ArsR family regulator